MHSNDWIPCKMLLRIWAPSNYAVLVASHLWAGLTKQTECQPLQPGEV